MGFRAERDQRKKVTSITDEDQIQQANIQSFKNWKVKKPEESLQNNNENNNTNNEAKINGSTNDPKINKKNVTSTKKLLFGGKIENGGAKEPITRQKNDKERTT